MLKSYFANNYDAISFHLVPGLTATTRHYQAVQPTANQPHGTEIRTKGFEDTC